MPTPVSTARQCLTDEAARTLDEAVSVARRRNHVQTTSLHLVSAFLSPTSSSLLRDALSRSRTSAFSPRLQFRALELSVGVSLDRLPCSRTHTEDEVSTPPVSNSLMAAIKRSQANQRRLPEMYHLYQMQCQSSNPISIASIKVELKQFVLSILDDPTVSRVFAEAGFRSCDIKLAIVRPPPTFLCNLTDSAYPVVGRTLPFPFSGGPAGDSNGDDYCKRIWGVLLRNSGRNPVLLGAGAKDALSRFKEWIEKGKMTLVCVEGDVKDFLANGEERGEEALDFKVRELRLTVERGEGDGVVVNVGGLEVLVEDGVPGDAVRRLVSKFATLLDLQRKRLWIIGAAAVHDTYSKLVQRFPSIEKDWDLHPLPITSTKSSLMGSFVPFGGFFSAPSEFTSPFPMITQCFTRCGDCNKKCEHELSAVTQGGGSASVVDRCSASLPLWLQMADSNSNGTKSVVPEAKDDNAGSNSTILALQRKWDDICKRHQQIPTIHAPGIPLPRPELSRVTGIPFTATKQSNGGGDTSSDDIVRSRTISCMPFVARSTSSRQHDRTSPSPEENGDSSSKLDSGASTRLPHGRDNNPGSPTSCPRATTLIHDHVPCSSNSVDTDLDLGTIYSYNSSDLKVVDFEDHGEQPQTLSDPVHIHLDEINPKESNQIMQSCSPTGPDLDPAEYKALFRKLIEAVGWQHDAVCSISQIVLSCRSGTDTRALNTRRDIWMSFTGADVIGKKKIAEAIAEAIFGSRESLVVIDLSCHGWSGVTDSILSYGQPDYSDKIRRKTIVGCMAEELAKKPHSVVFLENADEADLMVQTSLFHAIRTGKFPDSRGKEVSIGNIIFVVCATTRREKSRVSCEDEGLRFSEQRVLEARSWQLQIVDEFVDKEAIAHSSSSPTVGMLHESKKEALRQVSLKKRKLSPASYSEDSARKSSKVASNYIDLNLPLEEDSECTDVESTDSASALDNSGAWLEDFLVLVHGRVAFKPFDFDALADQLMKKITLQFQRNLGSGTRLEIEDDVMVELLAAAWCSSRKGAMDEWIDQVIGTGFAEAQKRYRLTANSVIKLVACKGLPFRETAPGVCLPTRINLLG